MTGFLPSDVQVKNARGFKSLQEVQKFLDSEVKTIDEFEKGLLNELRELDDLKNNFAVVESQMVSIRRLFDSRNEVVRQIFDESSKRNSEINKQKINELFQILSQLETQLRPMMERVSQELRKLYIEETHIIYLKADTGRKVMHEIDEKARNMASELLVIIRNTESMDRDLQRVSIELNKMNSEKGPKAVPKGRVGYNLDSHT